MKKALVIFLLMCGAHVSSAQGLDSLRLHALQDFASHLPEGAEIAVAYIHGETVAFYGYKIEGAPKAVNNEQTGFEIGSLTKVFTATVFAGMVEDEFVKPNDRADRLLHIKMNGKVSMTLEQLVNHTSGLPRIPSNLMFTQEFQMNNPYRNYTPLDVLNYLQRDVVLIQKPGKQFAYSNVGMGLLGMVLERVSGNTFEQLVNRYVTGPLKMNQTMVNRQQFDGQLAVGHSRMGGETNYWDFGSLHGAGALVSTVRDLSYFVQAQFSETETAIAKTHEASFKQSDELSVGWGWMLVSNRNKTYYFHNGGTGGFSSSMLIDPVSESGVVILCSVSPDYFQKENTDHLARTLMQIP